MFALRVATVALLVSTVRSRIVPTADGLQELVEDNWRGSKMDLFLETTSREKSGDDTPPAAVSTQLNPNHISNQSGKDKTRRRKSPTYPVPVIYQQPVYHHSLSAPASYPSTYQPSGAVYPSLPNAARCFKIQPTSFIVCQLPPSTSTSAYREVKTAAQGRGTNAHMTHGHGLGNRIGPEGKSGSYFQYPPLGIPSYTPPVFSSIPTVPYPPRPFTPYSPPLNYDTANLALGLQVHPPFPQYPSPLAQLYVKPLHDAAQCEASQYGASASGVPTNTASAYGAAYSTGLPSSAYRDDNVGDAGGQSHHTHVHLTRTHLGHGHHHHHRQHNHHTRRSDSGGEEEGEDGPQKVIVPLPRVLSEDSEDGDGHSSADERDSSSSMVNNRFMNENTIAMPSMT